MAAMAASAEQTADFLQNLSLDSQSKTLDATEQQGKDGSVSAGTPNGMAEPFNPTSCYLTNGFLPPAYYFGGYDAQGNPWNDYIYLNADGPIAPNVYGDNCSYMFSQGYGYTPYGYTPPTSPAPSMQPDGQLYGMQHYQYHGPYYQNAASTNGSTIANKGGSYPGQFPSSVAGDQMSLSYDINKSRNCKILNGDAANENNGRKPLVSSSQDSSLNHTHDKLVMPPCLPLPGYPDLRGFSDGIQSQIPLPDGLTVPTGQNRRPSRAGVSSMMAYGEDFSSWSNTNVHPPQFMNMQNTRPLPGLDLASGYMNEVFSGNRMYSRYENSLRSGTGFGSGCSSYRSNGRGWNIDGKFKFGGYGNRAAGFGKENFNAFNELNKGPRAKAGDNKNNKGMEPVTLLLKGQSLPASNVEKVTSQVTNKEEFSGEGFPDNYDNAKFFVIKSYSEDDIHKSIKYGVWASTPNGNKKLDAAYHEAKEIQDSCPVFLLFSVNASGQFVGLAEMIGRVDFDRTLEYWQQDKWNGCFPVKWHIIKDVPNGLLKHIILENNENKPVTNSRDTQEVKIDQGIQIVKIFKSHPSKTCIMDDFGFYDSRQMTMQESKSKDRQFWKQPVKVSDLPIADESRLTESLDVASTKLSVDAEQETNEAGREVKVFGEKELATAIEDGA